MPSIKQLLGRARSGQNRDPDVERIDKLIQESDRRRKRAGPGETSIAEIARRNGARFLGDHRTQPVSVTPGSLLNEEGHKLPPEQPAHKSGIVAAQLNRTSTSIIATTAAMTESPLYIKFEPTESNDPELYSLKPKAARKLALLMQNEVFVAGQEAPILLNGFSPQELAGEAFIDDARAEWMMENLLDPLTGRPLVATADFHIVSDATDAKVAQMVFDNRWSQDISNGRAVVIEHILYNSIFGFQPALIQWDFNEHSWTMENVPGLSVFPDPYHTSRPEQWDYVVLEYWISREKAIRFFPDFEKQIKRASLEGGLEADGTHELPSSFQGDRYEREMVQVRIAWEKHEDVPMNIEEALLGMKVAPHEDDPSRFALIDEETGEPTEQIVAPGGDGWPMRKGIMQTMVLPQLDLKIDKRRCPYLHEPLIWSINTPIMHSPWGIGEPFRLEDIQKEINQELTILKNWRRYYAYPVVYMPAKLHEALRKKGFTAHVAPGRIFPINDDEYLKIATRRGRVTLTEEPPPIPADITATLRILLEEHDRLSGHVEALQGRTPGAQTSGVLFQQLRAEARGPIGLRSRLVEFSFHRAARIIWDAILKWLPMPVWEEILNGLPRHVIIEHRRRMAPNRFNIRVEVATSRALTEQERRSESREMYGAGLLDRTTAIEDHGRNAEMIERRIMEQQTKEAQSAVAAQNVLAAAGTQPDQSPARTTSEPG